MKKVMEYNPISNDDRVFLDRLRGLSIIRVVLVHLGLSWFYPPYSYYFNALLPVLFFVSGAVSLPIFFRSKGVGHYFAKRLTSVLVPYYVIACGIFLAALFLKWDPATNYLAQIARWLLVVPEPSDRLFPLGQIWFIRSLTVIVILSVPIFFISRVFGRHVLLVPVLLSLIFSYVSCFYDSTAYHYASIFNLYQPAVFSGFFFFGAWYYAGAPLSTPVQGLLFVFFLITPFIVMQYFNLPFALAEHLFTPTYYYIGLAFAAIFLAILIKPFIQNLLYSVRTLDWFVMFNSKHAYSIFILHSLTIFLTEKFLGLKGVASDPHLAILKLVLVYGGTMLMAIPVSYCTKYVQSAIAKKLNNRERVPSENTALNR